jgi:hypothetical protein
MQTFLPYADFKRSAAVLDRQRLGKQRVEDLQIMKALTVPDYGWKNHPATKMWEGYEQALLEYHNAICDEWTSRGYKDTCKEKAALLIPPLSKIIYPSWLMDWEFHASHRSNLLRKDPIWYGQFGWQETPDIEYVWPTKGK